MPRKRAKFVYAKEPIVIVVGAKAPVYKTRQVRNQRTGTVDTVELNPEAPPEEPGDSGVPYSFKSGQKVSAEHPAVLAKPYAFTEDGDEAEAEPEAAIA